MSKGKGHDRFNLLLGAVILGILLGFEKSWQLCLSFSIGWLLSTLLFSPDADLGPQKRTGILRLFLYPYTFLSRHRGWSHSILWGTLGRILYLTVVVGVLVYLFNRLGYLPYTAKNFFQLVEKFIRHYDYRQFHYKVAVWFLVGMFGADLCHVFLDRVSTFFKRLIP
ncbi:MAG: DUF2227 family putative metal-binding protein [Pseudomonadota bacterium]